jgi:hypothetical protein
VATFQRLAAQTGLGCRRRTMTSSPWPSPPKEERETAPRPVSTEVRVKSSGDGRSMVRKQWRLDPFPHASRVEACCARGRAHAGPSRPRCWWYTEDASAFCHRLKNTLPTTWERVSLALVSAIKVSHHQHGLPLPATCARPSPAASTALAPHPPTTVPRSSAQDKGPQPSTLNFQPYQAIGLPS